MAKTAWSVQAIDDLSGIEDYLSTSSKKHAELIVDAILQAVELLEQFPELGKVVPEMRLSHLD